MLPYLLRAYEEAARMDISRRTMLGGSAAVALAGLVPGARPVRYRPDVRYPVTLGSADALITGRLHRPAGRPRGLVIAVPGMTYNAWYWDFPHSGNDFAAAMTACGWMVLALNLPGTDPSTGYPPPADLTIANEAAAVHQVITRAASWSRRIILAGHSVGSSIALEAAALGGVDALMLTGFTHNPSAAGQALARLAVVPAPGLPAGYITTAAGQRWKAFLQTDASPAVVALDEKLKTTGSATELATLAGSFDPSISRGLDMPVLIVNGTQDIISYGPGGTGTAIGTAAEEAPYWATAPAVWMLPGAPHDINLACNADAWFRQAARFAAELDQ
jgi:pimeloyl-ACP methyl ester carboxylesterase